MDTGNKCCPSLRGQSSSSSSGTSSEKSWQSRWSLHATCVVVGYPAVRLRLFRRAWLVDCVPNSLAVSDRAASVSLSDESGSSSEGLDGSGSGSTVAGSVATGGVVDAVTSDS